MLTGVFSTLLLPETKGKTLEELSNEDQKDFVKGQFALTRHVSIGFSCNSVLFPQVPPPSP